jgi:hypothetical protein
MLRRRPHRTILLSLFLLAGCMFVPARFAESAQQPRNLLANPGFELGRDGWNLGKAGKTDARFTIDKTEAYAGQFSGLITIEAVEEWGTQFGQTVDGGTVGKTYTFAVAAKATKAPATVALEIERHAKPWDRAAQSDKTTLKTDAWTELHVTFKVDKPFSEGWFAYVSCAQANAEYRLDACRLYEGEYVPYKEAARTEAQAASVRLFDTGTSSTAPLSGAAIANKAKWKQVAADQPDYPFKGDAVLVNHRLAVVLREGGPGAEVYSGGAKGWVPRAVLAPAGAPEVKLAVVSIIENASSGVTVDAAYQSPGAKPLVLRYELGIGQVFVRTEARQRVTALRTTAPCRYVVLPDFFADDMVVDAAEIPVATAELPSENFLLHLLPGNDAIVLSVCKDLGRDARVMLSGDGEKRLIDRSEVYYGKDKQIWVAVLEAPGIWHERPVAKEDAGKIIPLDWKSPYPALWRVDWRRTDKVASSWEMLTQLGNGEFEKHGWFGSPSRMPADRNRWTTVLGSFKYPCWIDNAGQGHLQPLRNRAVMFAGPAVIYPINRVSSTPLSEFTVVDIMRATLGVGPCEYILDVEGQGQSYKGRATCGTRDLLKGIYASKQQKQKRAEVERALADVEIFVKHIRGRIEQYVTFGHEMLPYLESQKKAHPELAEFLGEMETLTRAIDARFENRKTEIKTPQYVIDLTEKFRATLLDYEGDDALAKCRAITEAIVVVGGNQDELVGECRMAVRILRQRAGAAVPAEPRAAEIAREIRRRTQLVLRNATSYEAPRQ